MKKGDRVLVLVSEHGDKIQSKLDEVADKTGKKLKLKITPGDFDDETGEEQGAGKITRILRIPSSLKLHPRLSLGAKLDLDPRLAAVLQKRKSEEIK